MVRKLLVDEQKMKSSRTNITKIFYSSKNIDELLCKNDLSKNHILKIDRLLQAIYLKNGFTFEECANAIGNDILVSAIRNTVYRRNVVTRIPNNLYDHGQRIIDNTIGVESCTLPTLDDDVFLLEPGVWDNRKIIRGLFNRRAAYTVESLMKTRASIISSALMEVIYILGSNLRGPIEAGTFSIGGLYAVTIIAEEEDIGLILHARQGDLT